MGCVQLDDARRDRVWRHHLACCPLGHGIAEHSQAMEGMTLKDAGKRCTTGMAIGWRWKARCRRAGEKKAVGRLGSKYIGQTNVLQGGATHRNRDRPASIKRKIWKSIR